MFDPTAYENFKIIVEGSVYDADFTGDIKVVNRAEIVDLSILSRNFEIQFQLVNNAEITAGIVVSSNIELLAGEIMLEDEKAAGAYIEIQFFSQQKEEVLSGKVENITSELLELWGKDRRVETKTSLHYVNGEITHYSWKSIVSFQRIVTEDQAENLYELIDYSIQSLKMLTHVK